MQDLRIVFVGMISALGFLAAAPVAAQATAPAAPAATELKCTGTEDDVGADGAAVSRHYVFHVDIDLAAGTARYDGYPGTSVRVTASDVSFLLPREVGLKSPIWAYNNMVTLGLTQHAPRLTISRRTGEFRSGYAKGRCAPMRAAEGMF